MFVPLNINLVLKFSFRQMFIETIPERFIVHLNISDFYHHSYLSIDKKDSLAKVLFNSFISLINLFLINLLFLIHAIKLHGIFPCCIHNFFLRNAFNAGHFRHDIGQIEG